MMTTFLQRRVLNVPAAAVFMALLGLAAAAQPVAAVGLVALAVVGLIAATAPTATLVGIVALTALVPYALQNRYGVGGGEGRPGLLLSDVLLVFGLARAGFVLAGKALDRRRMLISVALLLFLAITFLQLVRAVWVDRNPSDAGAEFRRLLGFSTFFLALTIVDDLPQRARLLKSLLVIAVLLGLWGILQWVLQLGYSELTGGDIGVREGVALTTGGRGQVQGGLWGFPVAIVMSYAAIVAGAIRSLAARVLLWIALATNAISCLLTFERSFWVAAVLGCLFVTLKASGAQKLRVALAAPIAVISAFVALGTFAPGELTTARERLLSLGKYESDSSVRYRVVESRHVVDEIQAHPVHGSGLAATIHWGRPYEQVFPDTFTFTHNGYLWLAWKVGIPAALLLFGIIVAAIFVRGSPIGGPLDKAIRDSAQASLLALLLVTITFPSVNALSITATIGVLLALATHPVAPRR